MKPPTTHANNWHITMTGIQIDFIMKPALPLP